MQTKLIKLLLLVKKDNRCICLANQFLIWAILLKALA
mgnify:CR=1 FL=1